MTTLDKPQAELRAASELAAMRAQAARIKDNYAKAHAFFEQAKTKYTEAAPKGVTACFEPFHIGLLSRGGFAATLVRWDGNPDAVRAESWFNEYRKAEQKVATDPTKASKLQPAGAGAIAQTWERVTGDNKGVTSHPLWNRLRHLRFEIRKLDDMKDFAADLADADVRECLRNMRVSGSIAPAINPTADQSVRVAQAVVELEAEYQRLLSESTQQASLTLAAAGSVTSPFLLQAMRLSAGAPAGTGGVFKKYRWTTRPCSETEPESTVTTDTASVDIRLRRDGEHCVKVWGLDAEGYTIASSKDLKVTVRPLTLKGQINVVGDYDGAPVELNLLGTWLDDPAGPGPLEYLVRAVAGDLQRVSPAQARVQVDGVTYTGNASIYEWD